MSIGLILLIILIIFMIGGAPGWGYHTAGWGPSGIIGIIVIILIVLLITGRL